MMDKEILDSLRRADQELSEAIDLADDCGVDNEKKGLLETAAIAISNAIGAFRSEEQKSPPMFTYTPLLRPAPFSGIPTGWEYVALPRDAVLNTQTIHLPISEHRYGTIAYKEKLSDEVAERFDLKFLGEVEQSKGTDDGR